MEIVYDCVSGYSMGKACVESMRANSISASMYLRHSLSVGSRLSSAYKYSLLRTKVDS
jgi:hypothetical protein